MEKVSTEGEVQIKLRVMQPTSNITLHANQSLLSIKHSEVRIETGKEDSSIVGVVGHLDNRKARPVTHTSNDPLRSRLEFCNKGKVISLNSRFKGDRGRGY